MGRRGKFVNSFNGRFSGRSKKGSRVEAEDIEVASVSDRDGDVEVDDEYASKA